MKFYAKLVNAKGKIEGIGSDSTISITLTQGNRQEYTLVYTESGLHVYETANKEGGGILVFDGIKRRSKEELKGHKQKGEGTVKENWDKIFHPK